MQRVRQSLLSRARGRLLRPLDHAVIWLLYPPLRAFREIPTHLTPREMACLYDRARSIEHREGFRPTIVEIGSYVGASTCCLVAGLNRENLNGMIFCVDTWENDAMTEGHRDTLAEFEENTRSFQEQIIKCKGLSASMKQRVTDAADGIDLLFIDGDHSYDACLEDWRSYGPLLAPNGIVIMHDVGWATGVQRVVAEEISPRCALEGRLPNMWWGRLANANI